MADTGFVAAGAGTNVTGVGTEPWASANDITNPSDSFFANGNAALKEEQMNYLKGASFGFNIPAGSTIHGIEVRVRAMDPEGVADITHVIVGKDDSTLGSDLEGGATNTTATPTDYNYGGSSQLWGLSWTAAEINSANFQVRVSMNAGIVSTFVAGDPQISRILVRVTYLPPAGNTSFHIIG